MIHQKTTSLKTHDVLKLHGYWGLWIVTCRVCLAGTNETNWKERKRGLAFQESHERNVVKDGRGKVINSRHWSSHNSCWLFSLHFTILRWWRKKSCFLFICIFFLAWPDKCLESDCGWSTVFSLLLLLSPNCRLWWCLRMTALLECNYKREYITLFLPDVWFHVQLSPLLLFNNHMNKK